MNSAGMGGFFMHARGGLQTEYMGDEWFENVEASADEAGALDMFAKKFNLTDINKKIVFNMRGINAVAVKVNGVDFNTVIFNNSELDISDALIVGENTIELVLTNNLRNLLGPHHLEVGESYSVGPFSFFKGENFWSWTGKAKPWNDGYCVVDVSL